MGNEIEAIERATLDAVAPTNVLSHGDWLVPIDQTTIGRAISAVPLHHGHLSTGDIASIEQLFQKHGKHSRFRVADSVTLANIHRHLDKASYQTYQPTLTQTVDLHNLSTLAVTIPGYVVHTSKQPTESWRSVYLSSDFDPVDGANRVMSLSRSTFTTYVWAMSERGAVAAGTLSMSRQWLGFHGIRTLNVERGRGLAGLLMSKMAEIGVGAGYSNGYLQVDEGNKPAVNLYRRLGFQPYWRYHYWVK